MRVNFSPPMMKSVMDRTKIETRRVVIMPRTKQKQTWQDVDAARSSGRCVYFGSKYIVRCPYPEVGSVTVCGEQVLIQRIETGIRVKYIADDTTVDFAWDEIGSLRSRWEFLNVGVLKLAQPRFIPAILRRIYIRTEAVSNEWLSDIDHAGAVREGFPDRDAFCRYWNEKNERRGYGVATNPRVWVIRFSLERIEKKGNS